MSAEQTEAGRAGARALAALDALDLAVSLLTGVRDESGALVDFRFELANRPACQLAGVGVGELCGARLRERFPAFPAALLRSLARTLDGGERLRVELSADELFAGARPLPIALSATAIDGTLVVVCEDASDSSGRMRDLYEAVLAATSDWVSIADGDGRVIYVNEAGRRMVGMAPDADLSGRRIGGFSPEWARQRVLSEAMEVVRRDGVWRGEGARLHADGHEIPVSQVIVSRLDAAGEADFFATIARDMTHERNVAAALRESEERFRIAFEHAPIGMALLSLDGNFAQVNDAYCRTVRRSREWLLGRHPVEITHPDDAAFTRYAIDMMMSGSVPEFRYEKRYIDAEGETIWIEISIGLFRDADGHPQFVIGQSQDLGERRIAHTLQRSMMTMRPPAVDGVDIAVRYLPGSPDIEVGGDWYDVVKLPGGRVGVVIGDVVGRGVEAAATMSQLRTALRAYAVEGLEPAAVVGKLHRLVDRLHDGLSTTLVYLDLDPFTRELRYVCAGHLPPLFIADGAPPRFLMGARSTPLGAAPVGTVAEQETIVLAPGDTVLLYTDGLIERRDDRIDHRLEELRETVAGAPRDLDACLEHLTSALSGDGPRPDDVALLALRPRAAEAAPFEITIAGGARGLAPMRAALRVWLQGVGLSADESANVLIAVGEACANAIEHGAGAANPAVEVRAQLLDGEIVLAVRDHGTWKPIRTTSDRGHGLRLMRLLMDAIDIDITPDGTHVELRLGLDGRMAVANEPVPAVPGPAAIEIEREDDVPVARLLGEVDLARVAELRSALTAAVAPGDRGIVIDLREVAYLDSAGLHMLHEVANALVARGQALRVVAGEAPVARVLDLIGLQRTIPVDATIAAAAGALAAPRPGS